MLALVLILSATTLIFFALALFFGTELLKKFAFMRRFLDASGQLLSFSVPENRTRKQRMRTVVIRHAEQKPFVALIGFRLGDRHDPFGYAEGKDGVAIFETYVGRGAVTFEFLVAGTAVSDLTVRMSEEDDRLKPTSSYPPHWFQRFGLFG